MSPQRSSVNPNVSQERRLLPPPEELIGEIQKAEELLDRLEAEQGQARTRLAALRVELASQRQAEPPIQVRRPNSPPQPAPQSPEERVRLFRQLFRGLRLRGR
jgi:hypothetical protein